MEIYCYYFPQFYSIPENDFHWGKGFTDWKNVKSGKELYKGHYQPRIPKDRIYYDQSKKEVLEKQAELAKESGIDGFCFYHYWFDGKLTLEKPVENLLKNKNIDIKYCMSWANETWSKRWVGDDTTIIFQQKHTYNKEIWRKHFEYLKKHFLDERYLKKEGRPVFLIYQPDLIKEFNEMKEYWNELCEKELIKPIYFIATKSHEFKNINKITEEYDAIINFQPREISNSIFNKNKGVLYSKYFNFLRFFPERLLNILTKIKYKITKYKIVNYDEMWSLILKKAKLEKMINGKKIYQSGFVGWDNTARYGKKATIYHESTPQKFANNLQELIEIEKNKKNEMIFINAWNEWSEGAYLEPDEKYKEEYINKTKEAIKNAKYKARSNNSHV